MIHSFTFFGVYENIDLDIQGKLAVRHSIPPDRVISESVTGLQEVHRWKYKDDV
jgi:hypothetical protein